MWFHSPSNKRVVQVWQMGIQGSEQKGPHALSFFFEIQIKNSFKRWFFCFLFNNGNKNINSAFLPSTTKSVNLFWEKTKWHLQASHIQDSERSENKPKHHKAHHRQPCQQALHGDRLPLSEQISGGFRAKSSGEDSAI